MKIKNLFFACSIIGIVISSFFYGRNIERNSVNSDKNVTVITITKSDAPESGNEYTVEVRSGDKFTGGKVATKEIQSETFWPAMPKEVREKTDFLLSTFLNKEYFHLN